MFLETLRHTDIQTFRHEQQVFQADGGPTIGVVAYHIGNKGVIHKNYNGNNERGKNIKGRK